ncbi:amidohydrolase family protein [Paenisporosarcina sp.]|uniref:amidohydrolase family protein n=1 Tax=Paenisporosarcina sp. TaxID=1932001 RepID=UPI003C73731E
MKKSLKLLIFLIVACLSLIILFQVNQMVVIVPDGLYKRDETISVEIEEMRKSNLDLVDQYKDLTVIDVHSHDADALDVSERRNNENYTSVRDTWSKYGIDRTVLFGAVSDPTALKSDKLSWTYYQKYPELIYPSFSGFQTEKNSDGIAIVRKQLENGYMHIGEIFGAATYSPHASVLWKAQHPNSGILPEIYDIASEYDVPVLLHIDPPSGVPISQFEKAMDNHPKTTFIFAHGNVHTSPEFLRDLLERHENLMIDFFAGYTAYNPTSKFQLMDFVSLVEEYPNRFVIGSDSGYDIGIDKSYLAMYELIDLLSAKTAGKVAYQNFEQLMERQLPTQKQMDEIISLSKELHIEGKTFGLNKREANELIFTLNKKKSLKSKE